MLWPAEWSVLCLCCGQMEFCVIEAGVLIHCCPRVSPGSDSKHCHRNASIISHGQTILWTWNIDMAFKMWGMNMISDTYQPCSAAVLHIAARVLVDLSLFKGNLWLVHWNTRRVVSSLDQLEFTQSRGSKKFFSVQKTDIFTNRARCFKQYRLASGIIF